MCLIKLIIRVCLFFVVSTAAQDKNKQKLSNFIDDDRLIFDLDLEPRSLTLNLSVAEAVFYCNGKVELKNHHKNLTMELEWLNKENSTPSTVRSITEPFNSTTMRIRIFPNGHIGIAKVHCYWAGDRAQAHDADLIIGENPGNIELKECRAYDRRYVTCVFLAPTITRAFRNGYPPQYKFTELNNLSRVFHDKIQLIDSSEEDKLVFNFTPWYGNKIPHSTPMRLNVTLSEFGSSSHQFNVEPVHMTKVDFQLKPISSTQLDIHINHNSSDTSDARLCSGYVRQLVNQAAFIELQDINETSAQVIPIRHLSPSSEYRVCLRCYYEPTDESFNNETCNITKTKVEKFWRWYALVITIAVVFSLLTLVLTITLLTIRRCHPKKDSTRNSKTSSQRQNDLNVSSSSYAPVPTEDTAPVRSLRQFEGSSSGTTAHPYQQTPPGSLTVSIDDLPSVQDDKYTSIAIGIRDIIGPNHLDADGVNVQHDASL